MNKEILITDKGIEVPKETRISQIEEALIERGEELRQNEEMGALESSNGGLTEETIEQNKKLKERIIELKKEKEVLQGKI